MRTGAPEYVLVVSLEPLDATTTLFFGHLATAAGTLRVVRYGDPDLAGHMSGASAVIVVRALFEMEPVVRAGRALGIPLYYFADDNFMVLREQAGAWSAFVDRYSVANVREQLRPFAGVMLSSSPLMDFYARERLHARQILFPPIRWPQPIAAPPRAERSGGQASTTRSSIPGVGFFGGLHLHDTFRDYVLPAIRRLAAEQPVRLVVAGMTEPIAVSLGLTVTAQAYDRSYASGLRSLARAGIDVLVHPSVAGLANNEFKNPHALISASAIGAIPVVSARPPYAHLPDAQVALQCDDSADAWHAALSAALQPGIQQPIARRLADFCAAHFSGTLNRLAIDELIQAHKVPASSEGWWRRATIHRFLLADTVRRAVRRVGG